MSGELSVAEDGRFATVKVADNVLLDSRLALYHETQHWLAVSDLHLGSDPQATSRPEMLAAWGTPDVETRLLALIDHYRPSKLIIAGDVMNFNGRVADACRLLERLSARLPVVGIAGNHDHPSLVDAMGLMRSHQEDGFVFHHGHRLDEMLALIEREGGPSIHITGHSHPMTTFPMSGTEKRLPVFAKMPYPKSSPAEAVQRWIIPAFAPWASGAWPMKTSTEVTLFALEPGTVHPVQDGQIT